MEDLLYIEEIAKQNNLKVEFFEDNGLRAGTVDLHRKIIYLNVELLADLESLAIAFFHEWAHLINQETKKYYVYHNIVNFATISAKDFKKFKTTHLRAERYTDWIASELCSIYMPYIKYIPAYEGDEWLGVYPKHFENISLSEFRELIKDIRSNGLF